MITSLTDPKLAVEVLNALRMLCELPRIGIVAGQAVASLIDRFTGKGFAPVNDVDLFTLVPRPLKFDRKDLTPCVQGTGVFSFIHLDDYCNIGAMGLDLKDTYQISSVKRDGILNTVYYSTHMLEITEFESGFEMKDHYLEPEDRVRRIIKAFDINCTQVGLDLKSGKLVYTRAYAYFWKTRQLEVVSAHTPLQTAVRLVNKRNSIENAYLNEEQQLNALSCIVHNLNMLGEVQKKPSEYSIRHNWSEMPATKYLGESYVKRLNEAKSQSAVLADLFDVQEVVSTKSESNYFKGISKSRDENHFAQRYFQHFDSVMNLPVGPSRRAKHEYAKFLYKVKLLASGYMQLVKTADLEMPKRSKEFLSAKLAAINSSDTHKVIEKLSNSNQPVKVASLMEHWIAGDGSLDLYDKRYTSINHEELSKVLEYGPDCFSKRFNDQEYSKVLNFFEVQHSLFNLSVKNKDPREAIQFYYDFLEAVRAHPYLIGTLENAKHFHAEAQIDEIVAWASKMHIAGEAKLAKLKGRFSPKIAGATELLDRISLMNEGKDMSHCVGGYAAKVASGFTRIVSIKIGDGSRGSLNRATLSLKSVNLMQWLRSREVKMRLNAKEEHLLETKLKGKGFVIWEPEQLKAFANKTATRQCAEIALEFNEAVNAQVFNTIRSILGKNHELLDLLVQIIKGHKVTDIRKALRGFTDEYDIPRLEPPVFRTPNTGGTIFEDEDQDLHVQF